MRCAERYSPEFHAAHLAFLRANIVKFAAEGWPILNSLQAYTEDVLKAEADRYAGAVETLERIRDHANSAEDPALLAQHELDRIQRKGLA